MSETQIKILKILLLITGTISIYQLFVIRQLAQKLVVGKRQFDTIHDIADYLLGVIEKNDIELTEFDLIAIGAIAEANDVG